LFTGSLVEIEYTLMFHHLTRVTYPLNLNVRMNTLIQIQFVCINCPNLQQKGLGFIKDNLTCFQPASVRLPMCK